MVRHQQYVSSYSALFNAWIHPCSWHITHSLSILARPYYFPAVFQEAVAVTLNEINGQKVPAKVYNKLASLTETSRQNVVSAINALAVVLIEGAKKNASVEDFSASLYELGLDEEHCVHLRNAFRDNSEMIRDSLAVCGDIDNRYQGLSWRLDVEVSSRSVRNLNRPLYTLNLKTKSKESSLPSSALSSSTQAAIPSMSESSIHNCFLNVDHATLNYITEELERAVKESKTVHARRITRYVK